MSLLRCALALAACLATPTAAEAASISYIGSDGNAYLVSPDGARTVQLTRDGSSSSKYSMAGQTDAGTVVVERAGVFRWLHRDGTTKSGPWLAPKGNIGTGPLTSHVSPSGGFVVFWASNCTFACQSRFDRIVFMPEGPLISECTINCHDGYVLPRWIAGTPYAGFLDTGLNSLYVQSSSGPQEWFGFTDANFTAFDVSRDRGRVLAEITPTNATRPGTLVLLKSNGFAALPDVLCATDGFSSDGNGEPRWSPDGTQIAWHAPAGIYVSPAPVPRTDGTCALAPRLLVPGGRSPEWGPQGVPVPTSTPPPPPPGGGGGGSGGGGNVPATPPLEASVRPSGKLPKLRKALRRGIVFALRASAAGNVKLALLARGRVVARGSARIARPGTVKVRARFTAKAKRRYRSVRRLKLTARITMRDVAGRTTSTTRRIVLKR
jgi:hypothetical protein